MQEQPYLLDRHLDDLVGLPLRSLRSQIASADDLALSSAQRLARIVYWLTKVRGYKTVLRFFPHGVHDLGLLVRILDDEAALGRTSWEMRFVLLLWLALVCMLPFDLARFDQSSSTSQPAVDVVLSVGKRYLASSGKERDAAAYLLGRVFVRCAQPCRPKLSAQQGRRSAASARLPHLGARTARLDR